MKGIQLIQHKTADMGVVGGAGHVGLPLALVFASKGFRVLAYDINKQVLEIVRRGQMPFMEHGGPELLAKVLNDKKLELSSDPSGISKCQAVIITIGTPVDEFMNPDTKTMKRCMDEITPYLKNGQLIVLRSTVYPGTTQWLAKYMKLKRKKVDIAFCPERVVQGYTIEELQRLPQIISGVTPKAEKAAAKLFLSVAPEVVCLSPMEAEFAKLFNNAYRYIQFAITNQFFTIANSAGLDYNKILKGMKTNYPRAADIPGAGFAAGPCLYKDTMQLAAFSQNQFSLGHSATAINEGLVLHMVEKLKKRYPLEKMTIGLLGMAFKANSDDTRASLSYKLKRVLMFTAKEVLTTDPHVTTDKELKSLEEVSRRSDLLILCVPHKAYKTARLNHKKVIDIWGYLSRGAML